MTHTYKLSRRLAASDREVRTLRPLFLLLLVLLATACRIADTRKASIHVATVDQAAARGTYQLQDLSQGYAARVTR